jgi:hypothetical protein
MSSLLINSCQHSEVNKSTDNDTDDFEDFLRRKSYTFESHDGKMMNVPKENTSY